MKALFDQAKSLRNLPAFKYLRRLIAERPPGMSALKAATTYDTSPRSGCKAVIQYQTGLTDARIASREFLDNTPLESRGYKVTYQYRSSKPTLVRNFSDEERTRRRLAADTNFRRNMVKRLKRKLSAAKTARQLSDAILEVNSTREKFKSLQSAKWQVYNIRRVNIWEESARIKKLVSTLKPRAGKWKVKPLTSPSRVISNVDGVTHWKNGVPRSYDRCERILGIRSCALILSPQILSYCLHESDFLATLPEGYIWDSDGNGIKAVRLAGRDDYHPISDDLAGNKINWIISQIEHNANIRRKTELELAAQKASMEGVYVCYKDSLRAGNCAAGTQTFARRHSIDIRRHISAQELLTVGMGDDFNRVKLTITAASLRHKKEIERGYAELSEHFA